MLSAEMIDSRIVEKLQGDIKIFPCEHTRASNIGDPCEMHLYLSIKHWESAKPHDVAVQSTFEAGNTWEEFAIKRLKDCGFEVITPVWNDANRSWRIEEKNPDGSRRILITGREDLRIKDPETGDLYPVEVKSMSAQVFNRISSIDDMLNSSSMYMRRYPAQLMTYLWKFEKEKGFFFLVNKQNGMTKTIEVQLDWKMMEEILAKAERIYKAVESNTPPEYCDTCNGLFCDGCDFHDFCPVAGQPSELLIDTDLDTIIARLDDLKPYIREYEALKKQLKSAVGESEKVLTGSYLITQKIIHKKAYMVAERDELRMTIRPLEG